MCCLNWKRKQLGDCEAPEFLRISEKRSLANKPIVHEQWASCSTFPTSKRERWYATNQQKPAAIQKQNKHRIYNFSNFKLKPHQLQLHKRLMSIENSRPWTEDETVWEHGKTMKRKNSNFEWFDTFGGLRILKGKPIRLIR